MKKIILASNNKHKIEEFRSIFADCEVLALKDIGFNGEIVEDGKTFVENSLIKARTVFMFLKEKGIVASVIADDSGLCVPALNGEPGIHSARYSGDHDDKANRNKLLKKLLNKKDRTAYFSCTLVELFSESDYIIAEGRTYGTISKEEKGKTDFGYDCLFLSDDLGKTFGEATSEEKNSVSHRGRAIEKLKVLRNERERINL